MPSYDFAVDLTAMVTAAQHIGESVELFHDKDVADLVPTAGALGSEALAGAVAEFTSRWEEGLNNLMRDVEEMAGRLGKVATNYAEFDASGRDRLTQAAAQVRQTPVTKE